MKKYLLLSLILGITITSAMTASPSAEKREMEGVTIKNIEISDVPDGQFIGNFIRDTIAYTARIEIRDGDLYSIRIDAQNPGPGHEKAMKIVERVKRKKSLRVPLVKGAEISSKAILKAIELALQAGLNTLE